MRGGGIGLRVLVTGGAGFIGSHIAELCLANKYYTVVIDNLTNGKIKNVPTGAVFYKDDIRNEKLGRLVTREKIDVVFHHAAQTDVQTSIKDPLTDAAINIMGTINLLEACRQAGVKKVIYASSAALYGEPCYLPIDEQHPLKPQSGYGVSKQVPEQYLHLYSELYGLDFTILRYANVYGPRQAVSGEGGVVAIFISSLLRGQTPQIFGDGEQTRDFIYVKDVAMANLAAVKNGSGQILNVSTGIATSINKLYEMVSNACGIKTKAKSALERPGEIRHSYLDSSRTQAILYWRPETSLSKGIKDTVEYYVKFYGSVINSLECN